MPDAVPPAPTAGKALARATLLQTRTHPVLSTHTPTAAGTRTGLSPVSQTLRAAETLISAGLKLNREPGHSPQNGQFRQGQIPDSSRRLQSGREKPWSWLESCSRAASAQQPTSSSSKGLPGPTGRDISVPRPWGAPPARQGSQQQVFHCSHHPATSRQGKRGVPFPERQHLPSRRRGQQKFGITPTTHRAALSSPPDADLPAEHGRAAGEPFRRASAPREGRAQHRTWSTAAEAGSSQDQPAPPCPPEQEHLGLSSGFGAGRDSWEETRMSRHTHGIPHAHTVQRWDCHSCHGHPRGSSYTRRGQEAPSSPVALLGARWGAFPHRRVSWLLSQMTHSLLKCQYANTGSGISNYTAVRSRAPWLICPHRSCSQTLLWHCDTPTHQQTNSGHLLPPYPPWLQAH